MARRLDDPAVLSTALLARHLIVVGPDSTRPRLELAEEAVALIERGAMLNEHLARAARVHCLLELGDVPEAKAEIERMARAADRLKEPVRQWQVLLRRATVALLEGRFDDGARIATEALAIRRNAGDPAVLQHFVLQMFLARREPEHRGGLEGSIRWLVEQTPESSHWSCVLAVFLADAGRVEETREVFERIAAGGFARLAREKNSPALLAWMARVATFLWDERARASSTRCCCRTQIGTSCSVPRRRPASARRTVTWACSPPPAATSREQSATTSPGSR
jgi:tetratricopeptide (TPR) repeat protein